MKNEDVRTNHEIALDIDYRASVSKKNIRKTQSDIYILFMRGLQLKQIHELTGIPCTTVKSNVQREKEYLLKGHTNE